MVGSWAPKEFWLRRRAATEPPHRCVVALSEQPLRLGGRAHTSPRTSRSACRLSAWASFRLRRRDGRSRPVESTRRCYYKAIAVGACGGGAIFACVPAEGTPSFFSGSVSLWQVPQPASHLAFTPTSSEEPARPSTGPTSAFGLDPSCTPPCVALALAAPTRLKWAAAHATTTTPHAPSSTAMPPSALPITEARHAGVLGLAEAADGAVAPHASSFGAAGRPPRRRPRRAQRRRASAESFRRRATASTTCSGRAPGSRTTARRTTTAAGAARTARSCQSSRGFACRGYTSLPNPTHYEIQKVLVDHCGQDASQLLGKKMWLGSQDLGYYLEHMLGVTCRTKIFQSGDDVPGGARGSCTTLRRRARRSRRTATSDRLRFFHSDPERKGQTTSETGQQP